jgi:alpha-tubulin suppressor-like RCC1 family protein
MTQPNRYSCVPVRSALLAAALLSVGVPAFAQTAAGGANHTVILKSDGTVWTVGVNTSGQIGDNGTTTRKSPPYQVPGLTGIVAVASGGYHTMAITSTGDLYVCLIYRNSCRI